MLGYKFDYGEFEKAYLDNDDGEEDGTKYGEYVEPYDDNAFKEEIVEHSGLSMVFDGMNGEYVYVGKIYQKSVDGEYLETSNLDKLNQTKDYKILLKSLINLVFNKTKPIDYYDIHLHLITHYR